MEGEGYSHMTCKRKSYMGMIFVDEERRLKEDLSCTCERRIFTGGFPHGWRDRRLVSLERFGWDY